MGPWDVDVRDIMCEKKELYRYISYADQAGIDTRDCIYSKMCSGEQKIEKYGWKSNATVVRLPNKGGCLVYSAVLDKNDSMVEVKKELEKQKLLPVKIVIAPSPQHHLALSAFQKEFPNASYICGAGSSIMPSLREKRTDLRFDFTLQPGQSCPLLDENFEVCVINDDRTTEIVLMHKKTKTLIFSDLLYRSSTHVNGPGAKNKPYTFPSWFASGQEELFYEKDDEMSHGLLPKYRTHSEVRNVNVHGLKLSIQTILSWRFEFVLGCHVDPLKRESGRNLIRDAWSWVLNE